MSEPHNEPLISVIGIDPGTTGAAALLVNGEYETFLDWKGDHATAQTFSLWVDVYKPILVVIERVHAFPGQGVVSVDTFARATGWWDGLLSLLDPPRREVEPKEWQRVITEWDPNLTIREKHNSLEVARWLYPKAPLPLKKHHNRAEAILIARWAWIHAVKRGQLYEQQQAIDAYRLKWESRYREKYRRGRTRSAIQDPEAKMASNVVRRPLKRRSRKKVQSTNRRSAKA